eukprot:TRINITY_DN8094_c0_g1_i2.p3 TRINITY_DN8094_c0_g1~~TRINITY_DN8094_c0_g1_i2.p3  ORF type:complete len:121 (+),score=4.12 TRINITY_DN8094_c0_g1_i2:518-880(+)
MARPPLPRPLPDECGVTIPRPTGPFPFPTVTGEHPQLLMGGGGGGDSVDTGGNGGGSVEVHAGRINIEGRIDACGLKSKAKHGAGGSVLLLATGCIAVQHCTAAGAEGAGDGFVWWGKCE